MGKKWYSNILKILLIAIFYGYVVVAIFFSHIHIIDGDLVSHVHLFERTAEDQPFHSHSQSGIQLFSSLTSHNTGRDIIPSFVFGTSSVFIVPHKTILLCEGYATALQTDFSRRGPPVLS